MFNRYLTQDEINKNKVLTNVEITEIILNHKEALLSIHQYLDTLTKKIKFLEEANNFLTRFNKE